MRTLIAVLIFLHIGTALHADPKVTLVEGRLLVTGITVKDLRVVVAEGTTTEIAARPGLIGEWTSDGGLQRFTPKFPFQPGTKYRVLNADGGTIGEFAIPKKITSAAVLKEIYPTADTLPENVLRFYLIFDKPMSRGEAYTRVKILDETNKAVDQPFLELDEELWNRDQTRLTLLIDPGRIKQDVKPREDNGPVFVAGKKYTLQIDGKWLDADGNPLGKDRRKTYRIISPIAIAPTIKDFKIADPATAEQPLKLQFARVMDYGLTLRALTVVDAKDQRIEGEATLQPGELKWIFRPKAKWAPGEYKLLVEDILEDVSGNGLDRPFEVDVFRPIQKEITTKKQSIPFRVQ